MKRAIKSGDIRKDLEPFDLLRQPGKVTIKIGTTEGMGSVGGSALLRRSPARLEGMAFAFSENRTKVTLLDPAQVENAIVTRRLRFLAAVIDGKGRQVSRRIGQEEEIYSASVCPFNP